MPGEMAESGRGLPLASLAAGCYLASALLPAAPEVRLAVLIAGRVLLGIAESFYITGTMSWGIGRIGAARTGKVMSWQGIAMYAALGLGAPLGLGIQSAYGFAGVAVLAMVTPLLAIAIAFALPPVPIVAGDRVHVPVHRVLRLIWLPGLVLALATVPFASMAAFLPLAYSVKGWAGAGAAIVRTVVVSASTSPSTLTRMMAMLALPCEPAGRMTASFDSSASDTAQLPAPIA